MSGRVRKAKLAPHFQVGQECPQGHDVESPAIAVVALLKKSIGPEICPLMMIRQLQIRTNHPEYRRLGYTCSRQRY